MTSPRPDADTSATGSGALAADVELAAGLAALGMDPKDAAEYAAAHSAHGASPAERSMHPRETPETRPDVEGLVERVRAWLDNDAPPAALKAEGSSLAEDILSALSAYEGRLQELTRQIENACTRIVRAHHRIDAAEARASAAEKDAARLRETLGQISRMRTMPDDKMNTFTLGTAHRLALTALEQKPEGEG